MRLRLFGWSIACLALLAALGAQAASGANPWGPARVVALPLRGVSASALNAQIRTSSTVKVWSSSIASGLGGTYKYEMVGKNPLVTESNPVTNVAADVIPVIVKMQDSGRTFSPTKADSKCLPTGTADSLLLASPVYKKHAYSPGGTNIGTVQYLDGFQRENFAKYTVGSGAINPGYHVNLSPVTNHAAVTVNVSTAHGETLSGGCDGQAGLININWWDKYVQTKLLPSFKSSITPSHFPLFLFYDAFLSSDGQLDGCCILGYHSAYASPSFGGAVQTYATGLYNSTQAFTNSNDVTAISHEVGEWMDDPFVNNATPAWGHVGQVSGCQSNLEVGDPLSGQPTVTVKMSNGVTYNPQELAFRDWFYRTPSVGLHGWFSSQGTFTSDAGPACS